MAKTSNNPIRNTFEKLKSTFKFTGASLIPPGGNILGPGTENNTTTTLTTMGEIQTVLPPLNQNLVKMVNPYGTIPLFIKDGRITGWSQLQNVSHDFTFEKVQAALRQAENGDMTMLFGYYRDFFISSGATASELSKRKLSTISEPFSILPADKDNSDDKIAADVIKELLDHCPYFRSSLVHLMNAILYPVAIIEKTFQPIDENTYGENKHKLKYMIKKLDPIDYQLITYRLAYIPQGPLNMGSNGTLDRGTGQLYYNNISPFNIVGGVVDSRPEDTIWNPDSWEPNLRFWSVLDNGIINRNCASLQQPDPERHIVYRCNMLEGMARENWGGLGRAVLWWSIMAQMGIDKFLQCLQKYGVPFILAKVDTSDQTTVNQIYEAFSNANIVNAMAVNKDAIVELEQMNMTDAATAHEKFIQLCHDQISLLINGQTLGSSAKSTGMGSGVANLQGDVREDFIKYDRLSLANALEHGLFRQLLDYNGIKGATPKIVWGSSNTSDENVKLSTIMLNLDKAGYKITDESLSELSVKLGITIEKYDQTVTKNEQNNNKSSESIDSNDKTKEE